MRLRLWSGPRHFCHGLLAATFSSALASGPGLWFLLAADPAGCGDPGELFRPPPTVARATGFLIHKSQERGKFSDPPDEIGRRCELNDKLPTSHVYEWREHFNYL